MSPSPSHAPTAPKRVESRSTPVPAEDVSAEGLPREGFDWRRIAYFTLASRALDDLEESTNKNRASIPKDHVVLYQFSARGHDMAQTILGSLLTGADVAAVKCSTTVDAPGPTLTLAAESCCWTPAGNPVAESVIAPVNPVRGVTVT